MRILPTLIPARLLTAIALTLLPAASYPQDPSDQPDRDHPDQTVRFDGKWQTTVSCDASRGGLGYSYQFISEVKDGNFNGLHGTEGQPGFLRIMGTIHDDGDGRFYANGMTGSKEFVPGTDTAKGTEFGYHIRAHFDQRHGDGTRVEGRPCTIEFEKQDEGR